MLRNKSKILNSPECQEQQSFETNLITRSQVNQLKSSTPRNEPKGKKETTRDCQNYYWVADLAHMCRLLSKLTEYAPARNRTHRPLALVAVSNPRHQYWWYEP